MKLFILMLLGVASVSGQLSPWESPPPPSMPLAPRGRPSSFPPIKIKPIISPKEVSLKSVLLVVVPPKNSRLAWNVDSNWVQTCKSLVKSRTNLLDSWKVIGTVFPTNTSCSFPIIMNKQQEYFTVTNVLR